MSTTRPSKLPKFNTGSANRTEPTSGKKILGWTNGERPASSYFNWLHSIVNDWLEHLAMSPVRAYAVDGVAPEAAGWTDSGNGTMTCTDAGPSSVTVDKTVRVTLPLVRGVTYAAARFRVKPGDATSKVRCSLVRYRDGAVESVLGTADSNGTAAWQDVTLTASISLATANDQVIAVIGNLDVGTGAREFSLIELDPPTPG